MLHIFLPHRCVRVCFNSTFTHTPISCHQAWKHQCLLKHFQRGWNVFGADWWRRHVNGWLFPLPEPIIPNKTKDSDKQVFVWGSRPTCSFSDTLSSPQREISSSFIPGDLSLLALLPTDLVEVVTKFGLVQRCESSQRERWHILAGILEVEGWNTSVSG